MKRIHRARYMFILLLPVMIAGCSSGKEVLSEKSEAMKSVRSIAIVGFPGQCTHEGRETPFLTVSYEQLSQIKKLRIALQESVKAAIDQIGWTGVRPDDDYSMLDVHSVASLCDLLGVDAVMVGFYKSSSKEESTNTPLAQSGNVTMSVSQTYVQTFPTFDVCIIGRDGTLLFRVVSEGRKASFGKLLVDSLVRTESDETFYQRVLDALNGICEMMEERLG